MSLLEGLNDRQREAVLHRGSPLIVLAGPGTGKTRVITHRLARIIEDDGASPSSVVALTFTVKAAGEMRERLHGLIGESASGELFAGTFHSFGLGILQRFGDTIGLPIRLRVIDSAQRRGMLEDAVEACADAGLIGAKRLSQGGVGAVAERAWSWIERLRSAALFARDARELAGRWRGLIESPPTEWDTARVGAEREHLSRFDEAVGVYERFEAACLAGGLGTLEDFILQPIRILRESSHARAIVHHEARRVVVDEFQDVNGAQLALLRELTPPGGGADLCVVGDDDQAIYGFRGSDTRAFQHFRDTWTDAVTVPLEVNYRSTPAILAASRSIIERAGERFDPDKRLEAGGAGASDGSPVEAVHLADDAHAGHAIAAMILKELAASPGRTLESFAVIGRSHSTLDRAGDALELAGLPVVRSQPMSALDDEGVQDVLSWVRVLLEDSGTDALRLLVRPPFGMERDAALKLYRSYRRAVSRGTDASATGDEPEPFVSWLRKLEGRPDAADRFLVLHGRLSRAVASVPAHEAVASIIEHSGVSHAEALPARDRARRVSRLVDVLRFVRDAAHRIPVPGDLEAFWSHYQRLDEKEQSFRFRGDESVDEADDAAPNGSGVHLITAHQSKGLEFETVFVPNTGATKGQYGYHERSTEGSLPAELTGEPESDPRDELRRLFYVAMTRAERRLVVLAKKAKGRSKSLHFFHELIWPGKAPLSGWQPGDPVRLIDDTEVYADAAVATPDAIALERGGGGFDRALSVARRAARRAAAEALDASENADLTEAMQDELIDRLAESSRVLSAAARIERGDSAEDLPTWLTAGRVGVTAASLSAKRGEPEEPGASGIGVPLRAPLDLSFTKIHDYETCPACYYLKHERDLRDAPTAALGIGNAAHRALDRFYRQWLEADSEGAATPTKADLLEYGRACFAEAGGLDPERDGRELRQVLAQLDASYDAFHDERAEILMLEQDVRFSYARSGVADEPAHRILAKLDRVDGVTLSDGGRGFRIIDYKTGRARGDLLKPSKKVLQLGLYAMALAAHLETPIEELRGEAAYWILSTQETGGLSFEAMDVAGVRGRIDAAIEGMLAGRFERVPGCTGACRVFAGGFEDPGGI